MDFVWGKLRDFGLFRQSEGTADKRREISKFEGYLGLAYKVLSWEDNSLTLIVFLVLNFLFWLVIQLEIRPIGLIFLMILIVFFGDFFFNIKLDTQTIHLDAIDEMRTNLNDLVLSLKAFRKNSSGPFCVVAAMFFLAISFVAQHISTYLICYLSLLAVFFLPLIVQLLPPEHVARAKQLIRNLNSERGVLAEEELIPFISDKDFNQRDADLDSLVTNKTADSGNNSLISDVMSMPSHLDTEDRDDSLQEDDFMPGRTPDDLSSDSDSEHKGIRFDSRHFNGDSSSDEEARLAKDLNFGKLDELDGGQSARNAFTSAVDGAKSAASTYCYQLYDALVQKNQRARRTDSDSDEFEVVNYEDVE